MIAVAPGGVDVLDEGPGIEPGEDEEVFERFHRGTRRAPGAAGTGLGLPIARELARRWGGDVRIADRARRRRLAAVVVTRGPWPGLNRGPSTVDRMRAVVLWTPRGARRHRSSRRAITLAASSLSSQQIGLSSEPLTAGDELAPATPAATPTGTPTPPARKKKRRPHAHRDAPAHRHRRADRPGRAGRRPRRQPRRRLRRRR